MAAPEAQVQGAQIPAERGVLMVRRSERGMKRNAEIDPPVAPLDDCAQSPKSGRASRAERGVLPVRRSDGAVKRNAEIQLWASPAVMAAPEAQVQGAQAPAERGVL